MELDQAYNHCLGLARNHYENFPVASILLPKNIRKPTAAIYAFARNADDFADEGSDNDKARLDKLDSYERELDIIENGGASTDPVFIALAHTIRKFDLPVLQFRKLLSAFKQDVTKKRYDTIEEVLDYCDRSANPVGFLVLSLAGKNNELVIKQSNSICSALQIINFLQDISKDYEIGRIYLPLDEMKKFNIDESFLERREYNNDWQNLISSLLEKTEVLLKEGSTLAKSLDFRLGFEINLTVLGGMRIITKLRKINQSRFLYQARLNILDWVYLLVSSLVLTGKSRII